MFLFLILQYNNIKDVNQISLWDAIITSASDSVIDLNNQAAEYLAYDMSNKLKYY